MCTHDGDSNEPMGTARPACKGLAGAIAHGIGQMLEDLVDAAGHYLQLLGKHLELRVDSLGLTDSGDRCLHLFKTLEDIGASGSVRPRRSSSGGRRGADAGSTRGGRRCFLLRGRWRRCRRRRRGGWRWGGWRWWRCRRRGGWWWWRRRWYRWQFRAGGALAHQLIDSCLREQRVVVRRRHSKTSTMSLFMQSRSARFKSYGCPRGLPLS